MTAHIPRSTPQPAHTESHSKASASVRDAVIGMSDGLTVPFALAAGISGAIASSHIVVTAGIAELAAGGISMGLGGYLAARSDLDRYASEQQREYQETDEVPEEENLEVYNIFKGYGLADDDAQKVTSAISADRKRWVAFLMRFELGLEEPDQAGAPVSALTIGGSYVIGGLVPLFPYLFLSDSARALYVSAIVTAVALFVFGAVKGRLTGVSWIRAAIQTVSIGGVAAAFAFIIARWVTG